MKTVQKLNILVWKMSRFLSFFLPISTVLSISCFFPKKKNSQKWFQTWINDTLLDIFIKSRNDFFFNFWNPITHIVSTSNRNNLISVSVSVTQNHFHITKNEIFPQFKLLMIIAINRNSETTKINFTEANEKKKQI